MHVFYIAGNQYQTESIRSETFCGFFGPEDIQWAKEVPKKEPEVSIRPGTPWWVVLPSEHPSGTFLAHMVSSGPEKIHKKFRCVWTPFGIDFL